MCTICTGEISPRTSRDLSTCFLSHQPHCTWTSPPYQHSILYCSKNSLISPCTGIFQITDNWTNKCTTNVQRVYVSVCVCVLIPGADHMEWLSSSSFFSLILDRSVGLSAGIQYAEDWVSDTLWFESCIQQRKTTCLLSIKKSLACARASKLTTTNMYIARARCEYQMAVGSGGLNACWS